MIILIWFGVIFFAHSALNEELDRGIFMVSNTINGPKKIYTASEKLMTAEDFAQKNGIPLARVKQNWEKIPGSVNRNGEIFFWPGSRYPFNIGFHKLETSADKRYVLLKAISKYRYISHKELRLEEKQFDAMLEDYLSTKLIEPNNLGNTYGANAYDITKDGSDFLDSIVDKKRERRNKEILRFLGYAKGIKELVSTKNTQDTE